MVHQREVAKEHARGAQLLANPQSSPHGMGGPEPSAAEEDFLAGIEDVAPAAGSEAAEPAPKKAKEAAKSAPTPLSPEIQRRVSMTKKFTQLRSEISDEQAGPGEEAADDDAAAAPARKDAAPADGAAAAAAAQPEPAKAEAEPGPRAESAEEKPRREPAKPKPKAKGKKKAKSEAPTLESAPSAEQIKAVKARHEDWVPWLKQRSEPGVRVPSDPARHEAAVCEAFLAEMASRPAAASQGEERKGREAEKGRGKGKGREQQQPKGRRAAKLTTRPEEQEPEPEQQEGGGEPKPAQRQRRESKASRALGLEEAPSAELVRQVKTRRAEWIAWLIEQAGPDVQVVYDPAKHEAETCRSFLASQTKQRAGREGGVREGGGDKKKRERKEKKRTGRKSRGSRTADSSASAGKAAAEPAAATAGSEAEAGQDSERTIFHVTTDFVRRQDGKPSRSRSRKGAAKAAGKGEAEEAAKQGERYSPLRVTAEVFSPGGATVETDKALTVVVQDRGVGAIMVDEEEQGRGRR